MKVNSYEKSLLVGALIGVIQIVLLTVFMAMVLHLTDGYGFFYKESVNEQVRNIYLDDVDKIGYIVATIIPLILLRYDSIKYLLPIIISKSWKVWFKILSKHFGRYCAVLYVGTITLIATIIINLLCQKLGINQINTLLIIHYSFFLFWIKE